VRREWPGDRADEEAEADAATDCEDNRRRRYAGFGLTVGSCDGWDEAESCEDLDDALRKLVGEALAEGERMGDVFNMVSYGASSERGLAGFFGFLFFLSFFLSFLSRDAVEERAIEANAVVEEDEGAAEEEAMAGQKPPM
jgi:hypothetical protein